MNPTILSYLRCPVCKSEMREREDGKVCHCLGARTHSYDFARSGYLNLASPKDGDGDLKPAVQARKCFLEAGYYQPLSDAVNRTLDALQGGTVLDAGCGEGYYTNRMASGRDVLGVDLSRAGIDSAARVARASGSGAAFAVGSLFTLPVADASFDVITNLFAPCAEQEFLRVLRPGGTLLLVGAGERHLLGLKKILYKDPYLNLGRADLPTQMRQVSHERLTDRITVQGSAAIEALFSMTPYYWRTSAADKEKLSSRQTLETEIDFDIYQFRKDG